jgi:tetratricopeptide (TPR) repeat protein
MVDEAIQHLTDLETSGVDFTKLHLLLAEAQRRRNNIEEAVVEYQKALEIDGQLRLGFICEACGAKFSEWHSRCPACKAWDSLTLPERKQIQEAQLAESSKGMTRLEQDDVENEAIDLLEKEFASTHDYVFKQKADNIRMRQFSRHRRALQAKIKENPQNQELKQALAKLAAEQNEVEIKIYQDRLDHYPTDMKVRFQLGSRYFVARRFDDAIPLFQQSQVDGRCRAESRLYLGRCFFEKKFYDQATATLKAAVDDLDSASSRLALELNYWLGRGLEASGEVAKARETYGSLIQMDYNYRDARHRLKNLVAADEN